ncbi:VanZ family protein [Saccharopolyspora taberi]|uniref:VanZ family protein n=1 Tax=Saccharopolyspora taberi TaxID=60895 RepID=UPI0031CDDC7F
MAFDGFVPAVVVLFPAAVLAATVSGMVRSRHLPTAHTLRVPVIDGLLVYSVLFVGFLVFSPQEDAPLPVRPDLGNDVSMALTAHPGDSLPWVQLAGNVILLLPLGMLVPQRWPWFDNLGKIAMGALALSCTIELVQFLAISGRVASSDDVVLNTIGAVIGGLLIRAPWRSTRGDELTPQHSAGDQRQTVWGLIAKIEAERTRHGQRPFRRQPVR